MPIQRCIAGEEIKNLSDSELLAVIIGTGAKGNGVIEVSNSAVKAFGGLPGMYAAGIRELAARCGIGLTKAVKIHSAFEMGRRILSDRRELEQISSPEAVWKFFISETAGLVREEFRVLILNNKNRLIKRSVISVGTVSEALVHPREVYREAIREGGSAIIVVHNHPSGFLAPSSEDIKVTERLRDAGKLIGITLLDHVIVSDQGYLSLKEEGVL